MPSISHSLKDMSLAQKMKLLEEVWDSVVREEKDFKSPSWHKALLAERRELVEAGKAKFSPWKEVKERIRRRRSGSRRS